MWFTEDENFATNEIEDIMSSDESVTNLFSTNTYSLGDNLNDNADIIVTATQDENRQTK